MTPRPLPRAVIFDLDDTLFPERDYAFSGFGAVATAFATTLGEPARALADMQRLYDSPDRSRVFNALLAERDLPDDRTLVEQMIATYRNHAPVISLYDDAEEMITLLRSRVRLGLITDGPAVMQRAKVRALRLAERFDELIITDELGPGWGKPHPLAFETIAKKLDVPHAACTYVADNAGKDFVAPNELGWSTIQIVRAQGIYAAQPAAPFGQPQRRIKSLSELAELVSDS